MKTGFQFFELAILAEGKPFDGMAFGTFDDMLGRSVTLPIKDKNDFVANTLSAIEATRSESGELVGLPIDAGNHDKGDAAGWIVGAELVGEIVRLIPKWTRIGRELIGEGIRRFFSPTINLKDKVILGGALVNWPATTDSKGRVLLRPIELSSKVFTLEVQNTMSDTTKKQDGKVPAATPDVVQPELAASVAVAEQLKVEMAKQKEDFNAELKAELAKVTADFTAQLEQERNQRHISEFAQQVTGGSIRALPVGVEEIETFLSDLNQAQREAAESILSRTVESGLVELGELGHTRTQKGKAKLDQDLSKVLKTFVAEGGTVDEFFEANVELGGKDRYELSQYEEDK